MAVIFKKGNLVSMAKAGEINVLVHGCNCFHTMGAGIAKQVAKEFPLAYQADLKTGYGNKAKLGGYSVATQNGVTIINAYTQFRYGRGLQVDYDAVERVMKAIASDFLGDGFRIGVPMIGAGLAGGDWSKILTLIESAFVDTDITVVEFAP